MAFENVFGNVDYGAIPRARQMEADRLNRAVGQGIAAGQQAQSRELKKDNLKYKWKKEKLRQQLMLMLWQKLAT